MNSRQFAKIAKRVGFLGTDCRHYGVCSVPVLLRGDHLGKTL